MKKTLSIFVASVFAVNTATFAADYPCQAAYETSLAELQNDYVATVSRTLKTQTKSVGSGTRSVTFNKDGTTQSQQGSVLAGIYYTIGLSMYAGLGGALVGSVTAPVGDSEQENFELGRDGAVKGGTIAASTAAAGLSYFSFIDDNFDFKEITHPTSTHRFFKYVRLQTAKDVLSEIYQGREKLQSTYDERARVIRQLNEQYDKKLAKVNKDRAKDNLPPQTYQEAFPDQPKVELSETETSNQTITGLDTLRAHLQKSKKETITIDQIASTIQMINAEKSDTFCPNGEPLTFKQMLKAIKSRVN